MERNGRQIAVLLATYNGAKFLTAQLESLFSQTCSDFCVYIRDDGSSDDTLNIVEGYRQKYPDQVVVVEDGEKHIGAAKSFMRLLQSVESGYYMFCDQDDVWFETKIEKTLARMREVEMRAGEGTPVVVSTDLRVVDESLKVLRESFNADLKIDVFRKHPQMICVRHVVTGCAMMFNDRAKRVSLPMSPLASMHDEWIALNTHFNGGKISMMDDATMDYRQHGSNTLGADMASKGFWERFTAKRGRAEFRQTAKLLHDVFGVSYFRFLFYKFFYSWL